MYEQEMIKYLKALAGEVKDLKSAVTKLDTDVRNLCVGGKTIVKTQPISIEDLTTRQLVAAFVRYNLSLDQMMVLCDGKLSSQDIIKRLRRAGAIK